MRKMSCSGDGGGDGMLFEAGVVLAVQVWRLLPVVFVSVMVEQDETPPCVRLKHARVICRKRILPECLFKSFMLKRDNNWDPDT